MSKKQPEVQMFSSPTESEEALYKELGKLTPEQRLRNFSNLLQRIHGQSINTSRRLGGIVEIVNFPAD